MMGNFLTTLGSEPEDDRAMFEELGLNVARQDDNGANPRPDNRSGWLEGDAPRTPVDDLIDPQDEANFWNPERQLRRIKKGKVPPRPDGASNAEPRRGPREPGGGMIDIEARLDEIRDRGLMPPDASDLRARRARGCCSTGARCCCCARTTTSASPITRGCARRPPRRRCATAPARARRGWSAGTMRIHRRLEERLADFEGSEAALLFGSGYLANLGVVSALAREDDVVFSDRLNHASIIDGCRLSGAESFVYDHCDVEQLAWGLRQAGERGKLIVTDGVFSMDGDVAPLADSSAPDRPRASPRRRTRPDRSRTRSEAAPWPSSRPPLGRPASAARP